MLKKLKEYIKNKLIIFLEIDVLRNNIKSNYYEHDILQEQITTIKDRLDEITDVAVDVHQYRDNCSWAVVCVHGKIDYVKFVDLSGSDARDVRMFLKRYEGSNMIVDTLDKHMFLDVWK